MKESMLRMASKKSAPKGSARASTCKGKTAESTLASRIRWRFSEGLNQRSAAQTWTLNSRWRKMEEEARPHPRSRTRMPGLRSSAVQSHSVNQSELAPPLALSVTHSGLYLDERGKRSRDGFGSGLCFTQRCGFRMHAKTQRLSAAQAQRKGQKTAEDHAKTPRRKEWLSDGASFVELGKFAGLGCKLLMISNSFFDYTTGHCSISSC